METVFEDKKRRVIRKEEIVPFVIKEKGFYLVVISARCKSEKQLGGTDDEDLRVEIDGRKFPQLMNPQRYLDSPAAFSGSRLKGALQTIYYFVRLGAGGHTLTLLSDEGAFLEEVDVILLESFPRVRLDLHQEAQRADKRPLFTFVLVDLGLRSFTVKSAVRWHIFDGDDIKIIVDGKIKRNPTSLLHRNWVFSASPLRKVFHKEASEVKTFVENLSPKSLHYIEFWADESPTIHSIEFYFETEILSTPEVKAYTLGPRGEDYNRFDEEITRVVNDWNKEFLSQNQPPPKLLDPNVVKAIIYVESRMGYGASPTAHPAFPDVMQVADERNPAIHTLNNDGWIDPITAKTAREYEWVDGKEQMVDYHGKVNGNTVEDSIYWGVRWLYHKAQGIRQNGGRYWRSWEEAVANYNSKGNWDYQKTVYKIYREGIAPQGLKLWSIIFLLFLAAFFIPLRILWSHQGEFSVYKESISDTRDAQFSISVLDGLTVRRFPFSRYYANGLNPHAFHQDDTTLQYLWSGLKSEKRLAVFGKNIGQSEVVMILGYNRGSFRVIQKIDKYGSQEDVFQGDQVLITDIDADPEEEVIEQTLIPYENAHDQLWQSFYDLDPGRDLYRFTRQIKRMVGLNKEEG